MGSLNSLRADVAEALGEAGIRTVALGETKVVPPVAVVIPNDPYIIASAGTNTFGGEFNVGIRVLLMAGKGTGKVAANELDSMIEKAVLALHDFDVTEVSAPGTAELNGQPVFGSIISIEAIITFEEEA